MRELGFASCLIWLIAYVVVGLGCWHP